MSSLASARASKPKPARFPNAVIRVYFEELKGFGGGNRYAHVTCDVAKLAKNCSWSKTEKLWNSDEEDGGDFNHLAITSQTDSERLSGKNGDAERYPMYGVELEWKPDHNTLDDCKRGVKALTIIHKRLADIEAIAGPAASFGAFVQRVATAIGVGSADMPSKHGDHGRDFFQVSDIAGRIDGKIEEWRRSARVEYGLSETA